MKTSNNNVMQVITRKLPGRMSVTCSTLISPIPRYKSATRVLTTLEGLFFKTSILTSMINIDTVIPSAPLCLYKLILLKKSTIEFFKI